MISANRIRLVACLSLLALVGAAPADDASSAKNDEWPWPEWRTLRMHARAGAFFSGRVELTRRTGDDGLVFETQSTASFLGATVSRSRSETRIDAATGLARSHVRLSRKHARRFSFEDDHYVVEKLVPPEAGRGAPLEQWTVRSRGEHRYPRGESGEVLPVFDYYGMLLRLPRLDLRESGDEALVHIATKDGPAPYRVVVGEDRRSEATVRDLKQGAKRSVQTREQRLRIVPADPERADEGFLRMEGETEIWVEARSKTLLQIEGKAPKIPGRIRITLRAIE